MRPLNRTRYVGVGVVFAIFLLGATVASASMMSTLSSVDFIDHVFASGGGSYTKSLTSGADDGWSVFAANVGRYNQRDPQRDARVGRQNISDKDRSLLRDSFGFRPKPPSEPSIHCE
jgi:hypothetical protein